ncbi:hypothetical protein EVAR_87574_1 [Eumeta japonica]|uniref:Uncharacterized protein n=1 Tax=Eumeta variegata TaxID=151549 RepID=A0A4C1WPD7_EUMVA|nr:hypothetical protein EVAR_87574_1 [Eumeta japonica]
MLSFIIILHLGGGLSKDFAGDRSRAARGRLPPAGEYVFTLENVPNRNCLTQKSSKMFAQRRLKEVDYSQFPQLPAGRRGGRVPRDAMTLLAPYNRLSRK